MLLELDVCKNGVRHYHSFGRTAPVTPLSHLDGTGLFYPAMFDAQHPHT